MFFTLETVHQTVLQVFRKSGVVCSTDPENASTDFSVIVGYRPNGGENVIYLFCCKPSTQIFIRPFSVPSQIIPLTLLEQNGGMVSLIHPGRNEHAVILTAEPVETSHFGRIAANRSEIGGWETFHIRQIPPGLLWHDEQRRVVSHIDQLANRGLSAIDLYARCLGDQTSLCDHASTFGVREMASRFESLGLNCEFGFVQRQCGAEPLSLLRFAGGLTIQQLAQAVRCRFADLLRPGNLSVEYHPGNPLEVLVCQIDSGFTYHTWRDRKTDLDVVCGQEQRKLGFLVNKFFEDVEGGEKIFVLSMRGDSDMAAVCDLLGALREIGPVTLLAIMPSDEDHGTGTVVQLRDGLLQGYISGFAEHPWSPDLAAWTAVCRHVIALLRQVRARD